MNDVEILNLYTRMIEVYGDKLPNPIHEPIQFKHYVQLFNYYWRK